LRPARRLIAEDAQGSPVPGLLPRRHAACPRSEPETNRPRQNVMASCRRGVSSSSHIENANIEQNTEELRFTHKEDQWQVQGRQEVVVGFPLACGAGSSRCCSRHDSAMSLIQHPGMGRHGRRGNQQRCLWRAAALSRHRCGRSPNWRELTVIQQKAGVRPRTRNQQNAKTCRRVALSRPGGGARPQWQKRNAGAQAVQGATKRVGNPGTSNGNGMN